MSTGISNPESVDFIISSEDVFRFVVYEPQQLLDQHASALQLKLNHYLKLAEGDHKIRYPESDGKQLCIMVDLYAQPAAYIMEIFKQFKSKAAAYSVSLELAVNGEVLISRNDTPVQPVVTASRRQMAHSPAAHGHQAHSRVKKSGARSLYL